MKHGYSQKGFTRRSTGVRLDVAGWESSNLGRRHVSRLHDNRCWRSSCLAIAIGIGTLCFHGDQAYSQAPQPANQPVQTPRATLPKEVADRLAGVKTGLDGYCPVSILDDKKWVKGSPEHTVVLDNVLYYFPNAALKKKFILNTNKYTPALSGDCVVCFADEGVRHAGKVNYSAIHKGRLFLFPSQADKDRFMGNTKEYEDVDLAFQGMCSVCRVELRKAVPGDRSIGTISGGMRYYFRDAKTKKMFLREPSKYIEKR